MTKIEPPDSFHLDAAVGWLELGNPTEAGEELARLQPMLLDHPAVLDVRWSVCAAGGSWDAATEVAEHLVQIAPDQVSGWVHRAFALRRAKSGGLKQAWTALRPAFEKFPKEHIVPYNLACYAAQFGNLEDAWEWLHRAMEAAGDVQIVKKMALRDKDLEALWQRVETL